MILNQEYNKIDPSEQNSIIRKLIDSNNFTNNQFVAFSFLLAFKGFHSFSIIALEKILNENKINLFEKKEIIYIYINKFNFEKLISKANKGSKDWLDLTNLQYQFVKLLMVNLENKKELNFIFKKMYTLFEKKIEKSHKDGTYNLKHRKELLKKLDNLDELIENESGYVVVQKECFYNQDLSKFEIPSKVFESYPSHFRSGDIRVPEITISKYQNIQIVKHQFLIIENGIISMDSFEELVNSEDKIWYSDFRSCEILNEKFCIPRLYSQKFYVKPNKVNVEVKNPAKLMGNYIFIPAWYSTNICHWLCDVLPRIGFAIIIYPKIINLFYPKVPVTSLETLELIGVKR